MISQIPAPKPINTHHPKRPRAKSAVSDNGAGASVTSPIHKLQRTLGNRVINSFFHSTQIQAKLTLSHPNDEHEREADRIADQVMRMPDATELLSQHASVLTAQEVRTNQLCPNGIDRKCKQCEENEERHNVIQSKRSAIDSDTPYSRLESYIRGSRGRGAPLPSRTRAHFETRFGRDLSRVRIHTGSAAAESAKAINARAYTLGNDIVFNAAEYRPGTQTGNHLLAHELAHVMQQDGGKPAVQRRTYRDTFTTVAYLTGPLWNVQLTITNAPDEDTERLEAFIDACHDGIMNAARHLGEDPGISTRVLRVRIRFNPRASEDEIEHQAFDLAVASLPRPRRATREPAQTDVRTGPLHIPPDPSEQPRTGESNTERIRRQASTTMRVLANVVADADAEGFNRVVLTIENNGREIIPGFSKEQQTGPRSSGQTSAYTLRETLSVYMDEIMGGPGRWQIIFTRQGRAMSFSRFERVPEVAATARSEEDELRALGIPNRREIYAHIFQETERQLKEAGVMIAGFAIEQLVLWVVGGVLFRAVGLLGRAAFPRILALISRGTPASLGPALEVLSTTERAELTVLLQRVESGALSVAERTRLTSLLTRVEGALPATLTRAGTLLGRIRIPRVTSVTGSPAAFDTELVRRAAEIRATQAGLSLEAFTNYNVAVARVRTTSGEIVYLEAGNLPAGAHSEEYILAQLRDRALGLGRGARVEQLYSERIPCSNCSDVIRRFFGEETQVYYTVGNQPNRGRLLMEAYGL